MLKSSQAMIDGEGGDQSWSDPRRSVQAAETAAPTPPPTPPVGVNTKSGGKIKATKAISAFPKSRASSGDRRALRHPNRILTKQAKKPCSQAATVVATWPQRSESWNYWSQIEALIFWRTPLCARRSGIDQLCHLKGQPKPDAFCWCRLSVWFSASPLSAFLNFSFPPAARRPSQMS